MPGEHPYQIPEGCPQRCPLAPRTMKSTPGRGGSPQKPQRGSKKGARVSRAPQGGHRGMRGVHQGLCEDRATIPEAAPCQASPHWRWPSPRQMRRPPSCSCCPEGEASNDGLGEGGPPPGPAPQVTVQEGLIPIEVTCPAMLANRGVGLTNLR